jgi:hypothetical protein
MILARIQRGAMRTSVHMGLQLARFTQAPVRSTTSLVKKAAIYTMLLRVITLSIPVAHAAVPAAMVTDDTEPSPSIPLLTAGLVQASVTFSPLALNEQDASPFVPSTTTVPSIVVGKSHQTEQEEQAEALRQQEAARQQEEARKQQEELKRQQAAQRAAAEQKRKEALAAAAAQQARIIAETPSSGSVEDMAREMTIARFGENHWSAMRTLIQRESGFNIRALNARSGACGLGQALPCSKLPNGINTSAEAQIQWMLGYVANRYGNPISALQFHNAHHWY